MIRGPWEALSSLEQLQLILDNTGDLVSVHDRYGRFVAVSASAERLLGRSPEELLGAQPYDLIPTEDQETVLESHRIVLYEPSTPLLVQYRLRHADGRPRWFEARPDRIVLKDEEAPLILVVSRPIDHRVPKQATLVGLAPAQT